MPRDHGTKESTPTLNRRDGEYTSWTNAFYCCMREMNLLEPAEYMSTTSPLSAKRMILDGAKQRRTCKAIQIGECHTKSFPDETQSRLRDCAGLVTSEMASEMLSLPAASAPPLAPALPAICSYAKCPNPSDGDHTPWHSGYNSRRAF